MPQVDGILSTRMIRFWEKESKRRRPSMLPPNARESDPSPKPRVPIIAVSASLSEDGRFECIGNSFDGWLMKPIDFATLELLLMGVKDRGMKRDALYMPGRIGGWFFP
jgi:CheY-like chemotaxis protein